MIASIEGLVVDKGENFLIISVHGLGFQVNVSESLQKNPIS